MNVLGLCLLSHFWLACVNCLKLQNICNEDTFQYHNQTVNSFHRIELSNRLPRIGNYAADELLNFYDYFESRLAERLESNKKAYNSRLIELYSEGLLNSPQFTFENHTTANGLFAVLRAMRTFQVSGDQSEGQVKLNETIGRIEKGWLLAKHLMQYKRDFLQKTILSVEKFLKIIGALKADKYETMVFQNEQISEIYRKGIFRFDKFQLHRHSALFFDWKSIGEMFYSTYLPFTSSRYVNDSSCQKAKDLPVFFRSPWTR